MTCLEAQSNIVAYIENHLDKEKKIRFLKHIKSCEDCMEELSIYYTMIEGMRQLDENLPLSEDFVDALNVRINKELKFEKKKKKFLHSSLGLAFLTGFIFLIIGYMNFLNILYEDEQKKLKELQGNYYFTNTFHDILFEPNVDERILDIHIQEEEETSFYDKINQYIILEDVKKN